MTNQENIESPITGNNSDKMIQSTTDLLSFKNWNKNIEIFVKRINAENKGVFTIDRGNGDENQGINQVFFEKDCEKIHVSMDIWGRNGSRWSPTSHCKAVVVSVPHGWRHREVKRITAKNTNVMISQPVIDKVIQEAKDIFDIKMWDKMKESRSHRERNPAKMNFINWTNFINQFGEIKEDSWRAIPQGDIIEKETRKNIIRVSQPTAENTFRHSNCTQIDITTVNGSVKKENQDTQEDMIEKIKAVIDSGMEITNFNINFQGKSDEVVKVVNKVIGDKEVEVQ